MNYSHRELLAPLAERYVLGTMTRRARRRFGQLLDSDNTVAGMVMELEERLSPLAWSLSPVNPSQLVWARIARRMSLGRPSAAQPGKLIHWPALAAAMSAAFVAVSIGWWQSEMQEPEVVVETVVETVTEPLLPAVGVVAGDDGKALWVARVFPDINRLDVSVDNLPEQKDENDYELWILRDDGVPVSLGLLPQSGARSLTLSATAVDALGRGSTLAVSLEPVGGSPQDVPTGPVLFTTVLLAP